ncbi:helix-turn-helix domain-containing protein [Ideonella sp. DXS29W]|uniref:Helix-turn-helix domain-containing protein n=1 Tax=Ideonella lacteola TaxID=2984193 RepID=A0ABU9BUX8_9BURK
MSESWPETLTVRERLVEAAAQLFARRGFASTSIGEVAQAAGILKGNVAYYFKSKDDLLTAVIHAQRDRLMAELQPPAAEAGDDVRSAVMRLLRQVRGSAADLALHGCPVGSLAGEMGRTHAARHADAAGLLLGLETFLHQQFERVMPAGDARRCAEHLLALLQGAAVLAQAHRDAGVVERQVDQAEVWLDTVLARFPASAKR